MTRALIFLCILILLTACAPVLRPAQEGASTPAPELVDSTEAPLPIPESFTATPLPVETFTPSPIPPTETPIPTATATPVESLKAKVAVEKIICRYGPGKNYLYLIAFNVNTPIRLLGRTEGKNNWVLVENGQQDCWLDSTQVSIENGASIESLRVVYPTEYKIPVSPYYGPTKVLTAERTGDEIKIKWAEVLVSPGKYEDENMFPYIVEIWYCKDGEIHFDTLGSRIPEITFTDQEGCAEPSRGRVYIQEKHGYAGPAEIPWPGR